MTCEKLRVSWVRAPLCWLYYVVLSMSTYVPIFVGKNSNCSLFIGSNSPPWLLQISHRLPILPDIHHIDNVNNNVGCKNVGIRTFSGENTYDQSLSFWVSWICCQKCSHVCLPINQFVALRGHFLIWLKHFQVWAFHFWNSSFDPQFLPRSLKDSLGLSSVFPQIPPKTEQCSKSLYHSI
jgi:hypothetical protein